MQEPPGVDTRRQLRSLMSTAPLRENAYMDWPALESLFSEEFDSISGEEVVVAGGVILLGVL